MPSIRWNNQIVKKNNKSLVLQVIMEQESISRADIAQVTGLNKATVSSLVNELIEEDLTYESGLGESSGGRRPVMVNFNKSAGYAIGIDIGVNYILTILTDLKGEVLVEKNQPIQHFSNIDVIEHVKRIIHSIINEMPNSKLGIVGIGIAVPGLVNNEGTVLLAPNLGWKNVFLKKEIEAEFNLPVLIENEANAGAYGEKKFSNNKSIKDFIYVSAGIGIGVGIFLDSELYRGKSGFSGELGHMIIDINGRECNCGNKGCWEAYASEYALLKAANNNNLSLETYIQMAEENDETTLKLFEEIGCYLGYGITNIINAFNPEQVTIGNRLALAKKWLEQPIRQTVETHALSFHKSNVHLGFSELSIYSAALGVSIFAIENFILG